MARIQLTTKYYKATSQDSGVIFGNVDDFDENVSTCKFVFYNLNFDSYFRKKH